MQPTVISVTTPGRSFSGYKSNVNAVAMFSDGCRMVTSSRDRILRLWDLESGVVLKEMGGHESDVLAVAVSGDGKLIASGDDNGEFIAWRGDTGEPLIYSAGNAHADKIRTLDFSPDNAVLATGSKDTTAKLWCTKTWEARGNPITCSGGVYCIRYSPTSGSELAIATYSYIEVWDPNHSECIAKFKLMLNFSLAWTPDGTRLLSGSSILGLTIREWDTSTWKQVGNKWSGNTGAVQAVAVNPTGTLVACTSLDNHVRLWRLSDRRTIAVFIHSRPVSCVAFSIDGKHIFSGGLDDKISKWAVPEQNALLEQTPENKFPLTENVSEGQATNKMLPIDSVVPDANIIKHLPTGEELSTHDIDDGIDHNHYANSSLVKARKCDWDGALHDALKSVSIKPSLTGYLSQGIALCGNKLFRDAMKAFDFAFMFAGGSTTTIHLLLLVKAIALFNANRRQEAMLRIQELATVCPNMDILACRVVEAYLCVQLGIIALDDARHNEAVDHFTAAINSSAFSSEYAIHLKYEVFTALFGWDLKSMRHDAHQNRCRALLRAGRLVEAHEAHNYYGMDIRDEVAVACYRDWSTVFRKECLALHISNGDAALSAKDYDKAIELYSKVIDLGSAADTVFAGRCTAKLKKQLWEDALVDAQKVIELNPLSYLGYQLKHASMHGAQRYDEAIATIDFMLSRLDRVSDTHTQELRRQYVTSSEASNFIQKVIDAQLEDTPRRLLNTITGHLCDRDAQITTFKTSPEYEELLSSTMKHPSADFRMKKVVEVYFHSVMLSHRWEENEPLMRHIEGKNVYELKHVPGIMKLRSFCETARDAGYRWAWVDTCCIDQTNNVEVQLSVNSMFTWYRRSALTIIYLLDVPSSSQAGALARSVWNKRGWTVQEFLAPQVVLFYQQDWTLYLNDRTPNHKDSPVIMQELAEATGIDRQALVKFHPGMKGARQKLQWASARTTTLPEDIAYSLFGIFDIHLPVIYGEQKQNALGRLLRDIITQSGDITCLDWVGKSSEFNSCLPADITYYGALPSALLCGLPEDEMQASVSSLRHAVDIESASKLYQALNSLSAPKFSARRLHLPCIAFTVLEIRRERSKNPQKGFTFAVKADGLHDLLITTADKLPRARHSGQSFLLVRPWDRSLFELPDSSQPPDFSDEESEDDWTPPASPASATPVMFRGRKGSIGSESHSRISRLMARLRQPFSALLLAQLDGECKRIASDHNITVQVKDMTSIHKMIDIKTLDIL